MKFELAYLAAGAVIGAYLRYKIVGNEITLAGIPLSVLIVNVLGSFVLGLSMTGITKFGLDERYLLFLGVGFCGSLTTMSSFAFETVGLIDVRELLIALVNILLNVGLSILAIVCGKFLMLGLAG